MSLLPYLLDYELRPRRNDNLLGLIVSDMFDRPLQRVNRQLREFKSLDQDSTIKIDKDKFQINLDVQHFAPDEISVKISDGCVVIEAQHEEKKDDHGFVSRSFKRRYALPDDCNPEAVESKLSSDGVLMVVTPRHCERGERVVPITATGPIRRKHADDQADDKEESKTEENGEAELTKSPQKKRRR